MAPKRLIRKTLSAEPLAKAIADASTGKMHIAAAELAQNVAKEDGVKTAITLLEQWGLLNKGPAQNYKNETTINTPLKSPSPSAATPS